MLHFIEKSPDRLDQLYLGGYQELDQYLILVMINNMAEERGEFEIVVNVKAKLEILQHCEFVKVKDEVSKTKIACRHCQIELKYSGNISNFSDDLTRKHWAVSLLFSSPEHNVLMVSLCDRPMSVVRRPQFL